jgi:Tfp pilus assembly protein PilF
MSTRNPDAGVPEAVPEPDRHPGWQRPGAATYPAVKYPSGGMQPNPALERTGQQQPCWLPSSLRSSAAAQRERSAYVNVGRMLLRAALPLAMCLVVACSTAVPPARDDSPDFMIWKRHFDDGSRAMQEGRVADAEIALKAAIRAAEKFGPEHPSLAVSRVALSTIYAAQQKFSDASTLSQQALPVLERSLGPDNVMVGVSLIVIGFNEVLTSRGAKGTALVQRGMSVVEKSSDPSLFSIIPVGLLALSIANIAQGQPAQAEPFLRRAVLMAEQAGNYKALSGLAPVLVELAEIYTGVGSPASAESLYKKALQIQETVAGPNSADVSVVLEAYAAFLRKANRGSEAERLETRARAIKAATEGWRPRTPAFDSGALRNPLDPACFRVGPRPPDCPK